MLNAYKIKFTNACNGIGRYMHSFLIIASSEKFRKIHFNSYSIGTVLKYLTNYIIFCGFS